MAKIIAFFGDEIGGLSIDRVGLGAGALLLLSMLAYDLFDVGTDALISTADPGVAAFRGELEMAIAKNPRAGRGLASLMGKRREGPGRASHRSRMVPPAPRISMSSSVPRGL